MNIEEIYNKYFKEIFHYVCGISKDCSIAEEITQETFFKALKAIDSFDGKKDIRAWLFVIARNSFYTYCRNNKRLMDIENVEDISDRSEDIISKIVDEEISFKIHKCLHNMKEPYKEVFNLRVFGELSFERIGTIFGKSSGWARVTFYRAKNMIIEYMEEIDNGQN